MTEPAAAITDYVLAFESMILAAWFIGQPAGRSDLHLWFVVFFIAAGVASALGGTVHGFFAGHASRMGAVLWRGTLIAIGIVAASGWMIGAEVLWGEAPAGLMLAFVAVEFAAYAVVVTAVRDAFWIAAANYLLSTGFLVIAYWAAYQSHPTGALEVGLAGLALTFVAALGQHLRVGFHPVYLNHNALYHLVQGMALAMIFWSGRYLVNS